MLILYTCMLSPSWILIYLYLITTQYSPSHSHMITQLYALHLDDMPVGHPAQCLTSVQIEQSVNALKFNDSSENIQWFYLPFHDAHAISTL